MFTEFNEKHSEEVLELARKKGKISNEQLYELFCDYLEENKIDISEEKQDEEENKIFYTLLEEGKIGYDILYTLSDGEAFKQRFNKHFEKLGNDYHVAQIGRINEEEENISFADLYRKWDGNMPRGWFGLWCTCGHFFPLTPDLTEIDMESEGEAFTRRFDERPVKIKCSDMKTIDFCSDNIIRIRMNNGELFSVFPFKLDTSLVFDMVDNPMEILK